MENIYRGADAIADADLICDARRDIYDCLTEIFDRVKVKEGDILVVGCSSSEVVGSNIGKGSSYDTAKALFEVIYPELQQRGIFLAAQCCEHLNRALVIERECAETYGYEVVSVVPTYATCREPPASLQAAGISRPHPRNTLPRK